MYIQLVHGWEVYTVFALKISRFILKDVRPHILQLMTNFIILIFHRTCRKWFAAIFRVSMGEISSVRRRHCATKQSKKLTIGTKIVCTSIVFIFAGSHRVRVLVVSTSARSWHWHAVKAGTSCTDHEYYYAQSSCAPSRRAPGNHHTSKRFVTNPLPTVSHFVS